MDIFLAKMQACPFPLEKLRDSVELVQYGISERATEEAVGVPMLRMINLQDASWDLSDLKYIEMDVAEKSPYLLYEGDLLFNRTNSKELVGKCNVFNIPGEYVFASYLIRVRLNQKKLLPGYVTAYLSSSLGRIQIDAVSRQIAGMTNVNAEEIRDLLIPVPGLDIQQKITTAWNNALRHRDETVVASRRLLASIDDLLLTELGIALPPEPENNIAARIFTRSAAAVTGGRWDAPSHWRTLSFAGGKHKTVSLHSVCQINPPTAFAGLAEDSPVSFIPMEAVSEVYGTASLEQERPAGSSQAYTTFRDGDVIWAKITPCMENGKSAVVRNLTNCFGFGSTEFHVFRPMKELDADFLHTFLRLHVLRLHARLFFTGTSGHQRVDELFVRTLQIPLPPVIEQRRICEEIAARQQQARDLTDAAQTALENAKQEIEAMILAGDMTR
jgi:type I restriction enzyme S subunit